MRTYDFIFSLGYACAVSQALRDLGLQRGSYPFDWVGTLNPVMAPRMMSADFRDWFNREDLKLWDVRFEGGHIARIYKNMKTGFGFPHEFTNARDIDVAYEQVRLKYERRIARLHRTLSSAKNVLAIYLTRPQDARPSPAELAEAQRLIQEKYPQTTVEVLCIYEEESCERAEEVSASDGIRVVKARYRTELNGTLHHVVNRQQIMDYLRQNVTVVNPMTRDEMQELEREKKRKYLETLGSNRVRRWFNKKLLQWYRDLEVYLICQKLLPDDHPTWFDGDGK